MLWLSSISYGMAIDSVFSQYMREIQECVSKYPKEKVYLHFDNTSYFVGDTIWFKTYVATVETNRYSSLSRPLYVELVDRVGQIKEKQIVKLTNGEGYGQFILRPNMLSGYYEVRAYTKWMLSFSNDEYFSKTFPIYKKANESDFKRSIVNLDLCQSMKIRPEYENDDLIIKFYPEGGSLVKDVKSHVAFKIEGKYRSDIKANISIVSSDGKNILKAQTRHDGMGDFYYTPTNIPAIAKLSYNNQQYEFELPEAKPSGYVMTVDNKENEVNIKVECNSKTRKDTLAVFLFSGERPFIYKLIKYDNCSSEIVSIKNNDLPSGIIRISLINIKGQILCERFVFSYPINMTKIQINNVNPIYAPYSKIECELNVKDRYDKPVSGSLSVSIRDGLRSDFLEYDNNIFTSLLFTPYLKGYIHKPGYYFTSITKEKEEELDILMMIYGWRKYDKNQYLFPKRGRIGLPEKQLNIKGTVKSDIIKRTMKNITLNIALKDETGFITGETVTDKNGNFEIPMEYFIGNKEAIIQTLKQNGKRNTNSLIMLDRNFSPSLRELSIEEINPQWDNKDEWKIETERFDSLYIDSISHLYDNYLLDEIIVKSKRKNYKTEIDELGIDAYYDVRNVVDKLRDEGKFVSTIPDFLELVNPLFFWDRKSDSYTYRQKKVIFLLDGRILSSVEKKMMMTEIDGLETIYICHGSKGISTDLINNSKTINIEESLNDENIEHYDNKMISEDSLTDITKYVFIYLVSIPNRDILNKNESVPVGIRYTTLQGYSPVYEYYSPTYFQEDLYVGKPDMRRTLYWNPSVILDDEGKAYIECYNNQYSSPIVIQAEILTNDGKIGTITYTSINDKTINMRNE